jgi:hypothetical protein
VLSADASPLLDDFFEHLLLCHLDILALLNTDVDVDVAVANVSVAEDEDAGVFVAKGFHEFVPLFDVEGYIIGVHSALFH